MSEADMRSFQQRLIRFRPQAMIGYATCLFAFASFLERQGLAPPRPRAIISAAETLHDAQREVIERVFGCSVQNRYGCREVGPIAAECPEQGGMHVFADERLVEVVVDGRPARDGEMGELLVTDLRNYAMPFIRYRIGDVAVAREGSCACGRGLPLLERVVGRSSDLIVTPDGRMIHGEFFTHLFYGQSAIRRFHVHQPKIDRLEVKIVPAENGADPDLAGIEAEIRRHVGPAVELALRTVHADEIAPAKSGKFRFTTSDVARDWLEPGQMDESERKAV
jgi:phenylacetate-CoA ligase